MKNKGFSLVELIVVIAIMAILVGVAVPVYSSYIEKANAAKDEQLLGEINSAFADQRYSRRNEKSFIYFGRGIERTAQAPRGPFGCKGRRSSRADRNEH